MKFNISLTNSGIEFRLEEAPSEPLKPCPLANQTQPKGYYVYAHLCPQGKIFYVGKGRERRAWSKDRHPHWHRYVTNHLKGSYKVLILKDGLSQEESEYLESDWISQCGNELVNWVNAARPFDGEAYKRYKALRDAHDALLLEAKGLEKQDLALAAEKYIQALSDYRVYSAIQYDGGVGLVAQMQEEERAETGDFGPVGTLDRLTMCFVKIGKLEEAQQYTADFFVTYRASSGSPKKADIEKRIAKAFLKRSKAEPSVT